MRSFLLDRVDLRSLDLIIFQQSFYVHAHQNGKRNYFLESYFMSLEITDSVACPT